MSQLPKLAFAIVGVGIFFIGLALPSVPLIIMATVLVAIGIVGLR
jgi:hypothetical protein